MSPFQRLVIRALGILIRIQMSPGRLASETLPEYTARVDVIWQTETYPKIKAWEADATAALEEDS